MESRRKGGVLAALVSAFIFGFTPILGKLSYAGGSNAVMLTFFRGLFAVPVLFVILKLQKVDLGLSRRELRDLLLVGLLGSSPTPLLLYGSYSYIPVGLATVLHFMYPLVVALAGAVLFKSRLGGAKALSLLLGTAGILLFFEGATAVGAKGLLLALASSLTYTVYMLGVERTSLRHMHYFKLSMYFCLLSVLVSGGFGLLTGQLTFRLTPEAWVYSFLVSMFVSIGAITLFQLGIMLAGASTTAILSTLEPITGVLCGVLVLGEVLSLPKIIGCALILAGVLLVTVYETRAKSCMTSPKYIASATQKLYSLHKDCIKNRPGLQGGYREEHMSEKTFTTKYEEAEYKLADLAPREVELLRRVIEICFEAREGGNHPFGCLLADKDGNILMEQGNEENTLHGDCTAHAETRLMSRASQKYSKDELAEMTMYNCGEPCAMCAGAIYWSNVGRLVMIGRESALKAVTGDDIRNPTLDLPCRVVFARGQKEIEVLGPYLELEPEMMKAHENYWNPTQK